MPKEQVSSASDYAASSLKLYGAEVIKNRAIPDYRDGLKPVQRRIIFAMHSMRAIHLTKAARVVGETIGKYHAHGDSGTFQAMVGLTQAKSHYPLIFGEGNWGDLTNDAGAMRYVDCRLHPNSKYLVDYLDVADMMPNYDGKLLEPVVLPSQLPLLLILGAQGIAVGTTTSLPPHDPKRAIQVVSAWLQGERSTKKLTKILKSPVSKWGGVLVSPRSELQSLYQDGSGSLRFMTSYVQDGANSVRITGFPAYFVSSNESLTKFLNSLKSLPFVSKIVDESGIKQPINILVTFKKGTNFEKIKDQFEKLLQQSISYRWNVTISEAETERTEFKSINLPTFLSMWTDWRLNLEEKWILHLRDNVRTNQQRLDLIKRVCLLGKKLIDILHSQDPAKLFIKAGFTKDEVPRIMELRLATITKTNLKEVESKIRKLKAEEKGFTKTLKRLKDHLIEGLDNVAKVS